MQKTRGPVLIVGAGSSGMATALELRRQGVEAVIVDASAEPNRESRAGGMQPRTLELLDLHEVTDRLLAKRPRTRGYSHYYNRELIFSIDLTVAESRFAGPPGVTQVDIEGVLRERLSELGVEILWGCRLVGLDQDETSVVAHLETPDGPVDFTADWLVGSDGAHSTVRRLTGLEFQGTSLPESWALLEAPLDADLTPDLVRVFKLDGPRGPQQLVVAPIRDGIFRLQLDNRDPSLAHAPPTVAEMQEAFDRFTGMKGKVGEATWTSAFNIHLRQVVSYRSGRVLLAGDAAHIHTPAGAQGLNTGVQDGLNLGWKLGLVASGKARPALVDAYEGERLPIAREVLKLSETFAKSPTALRPDSSVSPVLLANRLGQLLVNYREGPLGQPARGEGKLGAGDRLPDIELDGGRIYHALRSGRIVVALFGAPQDVAEASSAFDDLTGAVDIWRRAEGDELARALGLVSGAAIIRPDAYLGLVSEGEVRGAASAVGHWLRSTMGLTTTVGIGRMAEKRT